MTHTAEDDVIRPKGMRTPDSPLTDRFRYARRSGLEQFAKARAEVGEISGALLVPERALVELQGSYQIGVLGDTTQESDVRPRDVMDEQQDRCNSRDRKLSPSSR